MLQQCAIKTANSNNNGGIAAAAAAIVAVQFMACVIACGGSQRSRISAQFVAMLCNMCVMPAALPHCCAVRRNKCNGGAIIIRMIIICKCLSASAALRNCSNQRAAQCAAAAAMQCARCKLQTTGNAIINGNGSTANVNAAAAMRRRAIMQY